MSTASRIAALAALSLCMILGSGAAKTPQLTRRIPVDPTGSAISLDRPAPTSFRSTAAGAPDTTVLGSWTFDSGGSTCITEGWTSVDNSAQIGTFFHVDDFAGLGGGDFGRLNALEGIQSMWCGARPSTADPLCGYATLPGYGNNWIQSFETAECLTVTGDASVDFLIAWDTEAGYDYVAVDVVECGTVWPSHTEIAGGKNVWDGVGGGFFSVTVHDSLFTDSLRVRIRFMSDGAWSDEDGVYDTDGAVILDSLTVRDTGGVLLPTEDFEPEAAGATATLSGNWTANVGPGAGDFAALFPGASVLQEDPCVSNLTCFWGFFSGSTWDYSCGGHPEQTAVTHAVNTTFGEFYLDNEIRSPWIPLAQTDGVFELAFDVYRDLPLDGGIFYLWRVRFTDGGCPGLWIESPFRYFGQYKDWFRFVDDLTQFVPTGATGMQVAIRTFDKCRFSYCFGEFCRSHAPLVDNVEVRRINQLGPRWTVPDLYLFQDNFASDGTTTGTVRADVAFDLLPYSSPHYHPADSASVSVSAPDGSLLADPYTGTGSAVYAYVNVRPPGQPGKQGAALTSDASRWPVVDSLAYAGDTWYTIRMDSTRTSSGEPGNRFCIDLNDNLFTPGDTVYYCYGAVSDQPVMASYYSRFTGVTNDMAYALSNPMEFTCLPTQHAYPIIPGSSASLWIEPTLYVDYADGRGVQPYFDAAFEELGITAHVDRYDVLGPSSGEGNSPAGRVVDVGAQLIPAYARIIWSTGDLKDNILGRPKADDAAMLLSFLDQVPLGGVFFTGDDIAETWDGLSGAAATMRSTYLPYTLSSGDHSVTYGVSPTVYGVANGMFDHGNLDSWVAYGGCPTLGDFDVVTPSGAATSEATYDVGPGSAVIAQETQKAGMYGPEWARVVLAGFSFDEIHSVTHQGQPDTPAHILWDILHYLNSSVYSGAGDGPALRNTLSQNVPNPFNPTTAIEFTVRERAPVTLRVYNVRGQLVRTLVDDVRLPGIVHHITWDGHNNAGQQVASGVYFYRLATKGFTKTKKMVLLK